MKTQHIYIDQILQYISNQLILLNSFLIEMLIIISQEQRKKKAMGCVPEKTKKQDRDNHHVTQVTENWHSLPNNRGQLTPIKTAYSQRQPLGYQMHAKNGSYNYSTNEFTTDQSRKQSIEELVNRYRIVVKQAFYKTNSIHTFNYQPLLTFNPPIDTVFVGERDTLDKTYNIYLNRQIIGHSKLLVSRK